MKCPNCKNNMKNVMHFEHGKNYAFHECKNCRTQTHQKRIHFDELNNKENLHRKG